MDNKEVIGLLKDAFELKRQTKYKQAMELLYKALAVCPDNVEILLQVADVHLLLNNPASACAIYERLLTKKPDDVDVFAKLIDYYLSIFNYDKVRLSISKFILAYPSEKAYIVYLNALNAMSNYEECFEFYVEKKLDSYNSDALDKAYAIALCRLKKYDDALKILSTLTQKCAYDEEVHYYYAKVLYLNDNLEEASRVIGVYAEDTKNSDIINLCGEIELSKNNFEKAISFFTKALKIKQNAQYLYNLATAFFLNGQLEEAKKFYAKAISFAPDVLEYRYSMAYLFYKEENLDKAKKAVEEILKLDPNFNEANLLLATILFDKKCYFQAEKVLMSARFEEEGKAYLELLAKVYVALYKNELAKEIYQKLLKNEPNSLDYRFELAKLCFGMKNLETAKELVDAIILDSPKYVNAYILAAKIYLDMYEFENALTMATKALDIDLNNVDALYLKTLAQVKLQEFDEAIQTAKILLTYNPHKYEAYALLGLCYAEKKEFATALEYYEEAITLNSKNPDYFLNAACLLSKLDKKKKALRYLYIAHTFRVDSKEITSRLIDAYIEQNQYKQVLKLLSEQISVTKEIEVRKSLSAQASEITDLYRKHASFVEFFLWQIFKI